MVAGPAAAGVQVNVADVAPAASVTAVGANEPPAVVAGVTVTGAVTAPFGVIVNVAAVPGVRVAGAVIATAVAALAGPIAVAVKVETVSPPVETPLTVTAPAREAVTVTVAEGCVAVSTTEVAESPWPERVTVTVEVSSPFGVSVKVAGTPTTNEVGPLRDTLVAAVTISAGLAWKIV